MKTHFIYLFLALTLINSQISSAADKIMNNTRLHELITRIVANPAGKTGSWSIQYEGIPIFIITSEKANRMRIISPIIASDSISKATLYRMMQANFDSALDARYSIAQGKLWSAFIHPLAELTEKQFFSGLAQTITLVKSFGKSYTSGALIFNGGDSNSLNKTYQDIVNKGMKI